MRTKDLLSLLEDYIPYSGEEARMYKQMVAFVQTNPTCLERSLLTGHITASSWITDISRKYALLTHHYKLDKWLQLGGHADGETDLKKVALKEAQEESGLQNFTFISEGIFDIDIHPIPARGTGPLHLHYDIRFLLEAEKEKPLTITRESKALAWVAIDKISALNSSPSISRMVQKHKQKFVIQH